MPRWFAPAAFAFAAIHTSAILFSMLFPGMPEGLMTLCTLVGRHWTIPWSILIAVSLAQAHYADVYEAVNKGSHVHDNLRSGCAVVLVL